MSKKKPPPMTPRREKLRNDAILAHAVNNLRKDRHPDWSRDQFLCHTHEAHDVCVTIRQAGEHLSFAAGYDDFTILNTYLNFSKRSKLPSGLSRRKHK